MDNEKLKKAFDLYRDKKYKLAFNLFTELSNEGSAEATNMMGIIYDSGHLGKRKSYDAYRCYYKAAEAGLAVAQNNLAHLYRTGKVVEKDLVAALKLSLQAAKQGFAPAQYEVGLAYQTGSGVTADNKTAYTWFSLASENNNEKAKVKIAEYELTKQYAESALNGDSDSALKVGFRYQNGVGSTVDYSKAFEFLKIAAAAGLAEAQFELIDYYSDNQTKLELLQSAAEAGLAEAINTLGTCYSAGDFGVAQNQTIAVDMYKQAAEKGNASAKYNFALCLYDGHGINKNKRLARKLLKEAVADNLSIAHVALAQDHISKVNFWQWGVMANYNQSKANKLLIQAIKLNNLDAHYLYGKYLFHTQSNANRKLALDLLIEAANKGHIDSRAFLQTKGYSKKKQKNDDEFYIYNTLHHN